MQNIIIRSISGLAFVVLMLLPLFVAYTWLAIVIYFAFMFVGLWEFYRLFNGHSVVSIQKFLNIVFFISVSLLIVLFQYLGFFWGLVLSLLASAFFVLLLLELWRSNGHPILNISVIIFGFLYTGFPLLLLVLSIQGNWLQWSMHDHSSSILFFVGMFALIWTNDTFAFICGKLFGKHPLFKRISPNKTWEGTIGGGLFALLGGYLIGTIFFHGFLYFWIGATVMIVLCAIFGDLIESLFKRSLNVKDSGTIIPGHGGVLDRLDATLFTIPFFLLYFFCYHQLSTNI